MASVVDAQIESGCQAGHHISIYDNPLHCNAELCWLFFPSTTVTIKVSQYPCQRPDAVKRIPVTDISPETLECMGILFES